MIGKAGYYKRKQEQRKAVSKVATIHDGEVNVNDSAAGNMFQMAVSSTQPNISEGIDVRDLPFFNVGRQPMTLMMSAPQSAISAKPSVPAITLNPDANADIETKHEVKCEEEPGEESENDDDPSMSAAGFLDQWSMSRPKAKAKTQATKAKGKSKAAPKAVAKETKRRKLQVETLDEPTVKVAKTNSSAATEEADKKLIEEKTAEIDNYRKTAFRCDSDTDNAIVDCLKTAIKSFSATEKSIKEKMKSLGRRTKGSADFVKSELDAILDEIQEAHKLANSLLQLTGEDTSLVTSMADMTSWTFSQSLHKRALKSACLSNLKFQDWKSFTGATKDQIAKVLGKDDGESFFWMMLNEFIQKLLRAIATKKVSYLHSDSEMAFICDTICFSLSMFMAK